MKTKFKDFLLYSLACVGAVSLLLSATQTQESHSNIGKYQITDDGGGGLFYILDTETGFVQKYAKEGKDTYKVKRTIQTK